MTESDYQEVLAKSLQEFRELYQEREVIDAKLVKLRQFISVTLNMVPEKEQPKWTKEIKETIDKLVTRSASLTDSVRRVFEDHPVYGFTASAIRGMLMEAGFDFTSYTSNPLSSISTTLRRMEDNGELKSMEDTEGARLYYRGDRPKRKFKKTEIVR